MEPIELPLIEIGGSDDSLIDEDLNPKSSRSEDLLNVAGAGAIHFECSPLQTLGFKPSSVRRFVPAIEMTSVDEEISASVEEVDNKENLNEKNLSVERLKQKTKMRKGYNLRKSLAWNSAFFTEEGVLDSSELSTLCDKSIRESKTNILSSISEETSPPRSKSGRKRFDESTATGNLHSESHGRSSNGSRILASALSRKAGTASQKSTTSTSSKVQTTKGNRIASNGGACPRPSASSSLKKPMSSNLSSVPALTSRLPKPPLPKSESSSVSSTKNASTGARGLSSTLNIPSGRLQKNVVLKGSNSTKTASGIVSFSSKSTLLRSGKIGGKSSLSAPVPTNSKLPLPSKSKSIAEKMVLNPGVLGDKSGPRNDTCLSEAVEPPAPTNNDRGEKIQTAQFQVAKPTGLRMPSPSLGFFDQKKASASPIILSPRGSHSSNLGEHSNPTFQKLSTPSHNGETKRATIRDVRPPREGNDSTKHRALTSGSTSKDQIPFNVTSPSVLKSSLEPNNLLTKLRSDFYSSTKNQTHTQQGSQVIQENFVVLDEVQMEVINPTRNELDHISIDENKLPEENGNVVLPQSGCSPQDQNNVNLETSEVTNSQGFSSARNESEFIGSERQVKSEMPVKQVDNLLGHNNEDYAVIESITVDNDDGNSSTDFKDETGVRDALVVHCGFSEIGLNGDRQSAGAETRETNCHDVNETKHEQKVFDAPLQINSQMHVSGAGEIMESDCGFRESEQQAELRNPQKILFQDSDKKLSGSLSIKQKTSVEGSLQEKKVGNFISSYREARGVLMQDSGVLDLSDPVVQLKESYRGEQSGVDTQMEALQFNSLHDHLSDENHDIYFDKKHGDSLVVANDADEPGRKQSELTETSSDEVERILGKCDLELQTHDKILHNEGIYSEQYKQEDDGNLLDIHSSTSEHPKDSNMANATNSSSERRASSVSSKDDCVTHLYMEDECLNSSGNNQSVGNQESIDGKLSERPLSENYEEKSPLRSIKDQIAAENGPKEDYMWTKIIKSDISPSCKNSNGSSMEANSPKLIHKRKSMEGLIPDARATKPKLNDELLATLEEAEGEKRASTSSIRSSKDNDSCSLGAGIDPADYGYAATSKSPIPSNVTSLSHLVTNSILEPNNLLTKLKSDSNLGASDDQILGQQGSQVVQDDSVALDEEQLEIRSLTSDGFDHMSHTENILAEKSSVQRRTSQDHGNAHPETSEDVQSQGITFDRTEPDLVLAEFQVDSEIQVKRVDSPIGSQNGEDTVIESLSVDYNDSILEISQDGDRQSGQSESREITLHDVNESKHEQKSRLEMGVEGFLPCDAVYSNDAVSQLGSEISASDGNCFRGSCDTDGEPEKHPHNESEEVLFEDGHEEQNESATFKQKELLDGSWKERDPRNLFGTPEDRDDSGRLMQSSDVVALPDPAMQLKESGCREHSRIEDKQVAALQFNCYDAHDEQLNSSITNASLGGVAEDADEQGPQQSEPINTSFVEVERILELQKHELISTNDDRYLEQAQEDNGKSFYFQSSTSERLPKDDNQENVKNSGSKRRVSIAAYEDGSVVHSHIVDMHLTSSSNNLPIENHGSTIDKPLEHLLSENYDADTLRPRSNQTGSEKDCVLSEITGRDLSPSSTDLNNESSMQGNCSKSMNKRKSLDDVKSDGRAMKPKLDAVPFSEEWLAALETAGEDILTMKSGAVQNSPTEKSVSEPNPWSPVKRKNNEEIGPFHCTKYTTALQPPNQ